MVNKSDKDFYGGASNFAYAACQWIEWMSEKNGRHIHHTLCGHGGERQFVKSGNCKVDSYEPTTETVYGFNGCKWHGCPCQPNRSARDEERYVATKRKEEAIKGACFTLVTALLQFLQVDKAMRSPYLEDLEEIGNAYEIREGKQTVSVDRAY